MTTKQIEKELGWKGPLMVNNTDTKPYHEPFTIIKDLLKTYEFV